MAVTNFRRDIWSAMLIEQFRNQSTWSMMVSREYEPEVMDAKRAKISSIQHSSITVKDFTRGSDMDAPETLNEGTEYILDLDQEKYYNFDVDDLDELQSRPNLQAEGLRAAIANVIDVVDQFVANVIAAAIPKANITVVNNAFDAIGVLSDTQKGFRNAYASVRVNYGEGNIFRNVMPWAMTDPYLFTGITNYVVDQGEGAGFQGASGAALRNGYRGRYREFDHYESNIRGIATTAERGGGAGEITLGADIANSIGSAANRGYVGSKERAIVFGFPGAVAFAHTVAKIEAYRPELRFSDAVKGQDVFGCVVVKPTDLYAIKVGVA